MRFANWSWMDSLDSQMFWTWQVFIWITTRKWVKRVSLFSIFILEFYRAPSLGELVKKVHILHVNTHLWARKWLRSFLFVLKSTAIIFCSRLEFQIVHSIGIQCFKPELSFVILSFVILSHSQFIIWRHFLDNFWDNFWDKVWNKFWDNFGDNL